MQLTTALDLGDSGLIATGDLEAWSQGPLVRPSVDPRADLDQQLSGRPGVGLLLGLATGGRDPAGRLAQVRWNLPGGDRGQSLLPPFDVSSPEMLDGLLSIPDATVTVQYTLRDGPFGDLEYAQSFVDGRLHEVTEGWGPDADLYLELDYLQYLRVRLGLIDMRSAVSGGSVTGDFARMSTFVGIVGAPEYEAEWATHTDGPRVLLQIGSALLPQGLGLPALTAWRRTDG